MGRRRRDLAVIHDATEPGLREIWALSDLIDATPHHYGARSMEGAAAWLADLGQDDEIEEIHYLGHGNRRGPMHNGRQITAAQLWALRTSCPHLKRVWLRCCDAGYHPHVVERLVDDLQADVVAHREVISAGRKRFPEWIPVLGGMRLPAPQRQGSIVGYTLAERRADVAPHWASGDPFGPGVSALRFRIPDGVLRPERAALAAVA